MSDSAIPPLSRRELSARRISLCAQTLTSERGFEGFTMEDLANSAGVSRRTLFNYFDSKLDAVLGPEPELSEEVTDQFRTGGPTGHLFDDLSQLAHAHFARMHQDRSQLALTRKVIRNPRILSACHQRFEVLAVRVLEMIREREGSQYDEVRAKVALGMLVMLCDVALNTFISTNDSRTFTDHYDESLSTAKSLLA